MWNKKTGKLFLQRKTTSSDANQSFYKKRDLVDISVTLKHERSKIFFNRICVKLRSMGSGTYLKYWGNWEYFCRVADFFPIVFTCNNVTSKIRVWTINFPRLWYRKWSSTPSFQNEREKGRRMLWGQNFKLINETAFKFINITKYIYIS